MRAVLGALSGGAAALAAARRDAPEGAVQEAAVLECLRLLRAAFDYDVPLVQRLRSAEAGERQTYLQTRQANASSIQLQLWWRCSSPLCVRL